jgi:regulatory protein
MRTHILSRKYGAAKIRQDLKSKGVPDEIVDTVSGADELDRAREILKRKYRSPATTREEWAKRARFLQGRGFSGEVIYRLIRTSDDE